MTRLFIRRVGLNLVEPGDGHCRCTLEVLPHHFDSGGVVHGGAACTLADTAMGAAWPPPRRDRA